MKQLVVILFLLMLTAVSAAKDNDSFEVSPTLTAQFTAMEQAQECRALKAVLRKAKAQLENLETLSTNTKKVLAEREKRLTQCGSAKSADPTSARDLASLAENCPNEYMDYLRPGLTQAAFQEDLRETSRSVKSLSSMLQNRCNMSPESASF